MLFRKVKRKNERNDQRHNSAVDRVVLEKRPHNPVSFLFPEPVRGVHDERVKNGDHHSAEKKPEEPFDLSAVIEDSAAVEKYRNDEPQAHHQVFERNRWLCAYDGREEDPDQVKEDSIKDRAVSQVGRENGLVERLDDQQQHGSGQERLGGQEKPEAVDIFLDVNGKRCCGDNEEESIFRIKNCHVKHDERIRDQ